MDQTKDQQPRGGFAAFMNRDKQPGDKRPAFEGHICKPGSDQKRPLPLWAHEYTDPKTGEVKIMFSGRAGKTVDTVVNADMSPAQQLAALTKPVQQLTRSQADATALALGNLTIADDQVTLFPNGFKDEAPDNNRPDYWGGYNPGDGSPIVRIAAWMQTDRNGRLYLSGGTTYPIPGKSEAEQQAIQPDMAALEQPSIAKYEPTIDASGKKRTGRGGGRGA